MINEVFGFIKKLLGIGMPCAFHSLTGLVSWGASRVFRRPGLHIRRYNLFILIGAGIVVGNWFYKNYMLVFRGVDLLPLLK